VALSEHHNQPTRGSGPALDAREWVTVGRSPSGSPFPLTADSHTEQSDWVRWIGLVSWVGLAAFVAAVSVLHGLQANLDPAQHTISEYSLGRYGWLMRGAFAVLGLSVLATAGCLRQRLADSPRWRAGLFLLTFTAIGLFLDALYNTDHLRVPETADGRMHGVGMLIVCLALPTASFLLGTDLVQMTNAVARAKWIQVLTVGQVLAIIGFETNLITYRGLMERIAVALAVATLALLQSASDVPQRRHRPIFSGRRRRADLTYP
jgi:hypothetical protein